jgi:hypothetical protein
MSLVAVHAGEWTVPTVVYATSDDIVDGKVGDEMLDRLRRALGEAAAVTRGLG